MHLLRIFENFLISFICSTLSIKKLKNPRQKEACSKLSSLDSQFTKQTWTYRGRIAYKNKWMLNLSTGSAAVTTGPIRPLSLCTIRLGPTPIGFSCTHILKS